MPPEDFPRVHPPCPICGGGSARVVRATRDHVVDAHFQLGRCERCDGLFIVDPPAPEVLGDFYDNTHGKGMQTRPGGMFTRLRDLLIARDTQPLRQRLKAGDRVVDLGTGDGSCARHMADRGFSTLAVDMYSAERWSDADIPYRQADLNGGRLSPADIGLAEGPPVGAVLRHVLEHLFEPAEVLSTLRTGGVEYVLVIVPNANSAFARRFGDAWYYWDPPRHLTFFTPSTLSRLAHRAGFTVEFGQTYGIDEVVTSAHRWLGLRRPDNAPGALQRLTRPTGPIAGISSALASPLASTVCHAVLRARPRTRVGSSDFS